MDITATKTWVIHHQSDLLNIRFYGKHADGLKMLMLALTGIGCLFLLGVIALPFVLTDDWGLFYLCLIPFLIIVAFLILNARMYWVVDEVEINKDRVTIKRYKGKKVKVDVLEIKDLQEVKINSPGKTDDASELALLIIAPILWFIIGASKKEPAPSFYTSSNFYRFFAFGSEMEKQWIILYIQDYLRKRNTGSALTGF